MPHAKTDNAESVLLNDMPDDHADWALSDGEGARWDELLSVRDTALKALEEAREQGVMKNQDAEVTLGLDGETFAAWEKGQFLSGFDESDLATLFIVSKVTVEQGSGEEVTASVKLSDAPKCPRCWNHDGHIGEAGHHGELWDRCAAVLAKEG